VSAKVGGGLWCHGLKTTESIADHAAAAVLMTAKAARCTVVAFRIVPRTIGHHRANAMMYGVASAHGSQDTNSVTNGGSHHLGPPMACMTRIVWLASNSAPAHQMAAIQIQRFERESGRASVMTFTLHQSRCEDPALQRTAGPMQRAAGVSCRQGRGAPEVCLLGAA
jgi:hypothetical protein